MDTTELEEAGTLALTGEPTGRRWKAKLIAGNTLGSSGYYPAETLIRDGSKVFKAGTPIYLNHQTAEERASRPFGRVQDFAGELTEDAYYDGDGLYANIEVFEHHAPLVKSLANKIGISIRAKAKTVDEVINGVSVPVVKQLVQARSADFVVKAGAGGKLVSILESALESSEEDSDNEEGSKENMDEVLEAISKLATATDKRFTAIEESLKPAEIEVLESKVDDSKVVELAEALAGSSLPKEAYGRVLSLHAASGKPVSELIEAEEAYLNTNRSGVTEDEGIVEESSKEDDKEVEESATEIALPSAWKTKVK